MPKKKHFPPESARDDWIRMTLRLPPEMHRDIAASAGALSMNAAIVQRLAQSLLTQDIKGMMEAALREKKEATKELELSNEIVSDVLARKEEFWKEGFKEGQKQGLSELKSMIEETVAEAVRKALAGKL